jgi:hypothetical protein
LIFRTILKIKPKSNSSAPGGLARENGFSQTLAKHDITWYKNCLKNYGTVGTLKRRGVTCLKKS